MTTRPKARKFRIRRNDGMRSHTDFGEAVATPPPPTPIRSAPSAEELMAPPTYVEDGFDDLAMPGSAAAAQAEATALAQAQSDEQGMSEAEQVER